MKHLVLFALAVTVFSLALRAEDAPKEEPEKAPWKDLFEKRTLKLDKDTLPYRLMKPADYDPKQKYPLVIFLHGSGESGTDNEAQLKHGLKPLASAEMRKQYPCFLVAPQCPDRKRGWTGRKATKDHLAGVGPVVLKLISELEKDFSIDSKRIYLTGLSMGGSGTWDLLAREPQLFAAGVPICGSGDPARAEKLAKIPLWVFHGDKDKAVDVDKSRKMVAAIKKAGGDPKYTEYPGVGHDSWTQSYENPELYKWLFAQKKE
jgi:predicted peptidase